MTSTYQLANSSQTSFELSDKVHILLLYDKNEAYDLCKSKGLGKSLCIKRAG